MSILSLENNFNVVDTITELNAYLPRDNNTFVQVRETKTTYPDKREPILFKYDEDANDWMIIAEGPLKVFSKISKKTLIEYDEIDLISIPLNNFMWDIKLYHGDRFIRNMDLNELTIKGNNIINLGEYKGYSLVYSFAYTSIDEELVNRSISNDDKIEFLQQRVASIDTSGVDGLDAKITLANENIATLETNLADTNTRVTVVESRATTIESDISDIDSRITGNDGDISNINITVTDLNNRVNNNTTNISGIDTRVVSVENELSSKVTTSLNINGNILEYINELGDTTNIDLSLYLDDTNLARLTSGVLDSTTGIATFTRDDNTTFTLDMSSLLDGGNGKINSAIITTLNHIPDNTTIDVPVGSNAVSVGPITTGDNVVINVPDGSNYVII